MVNEENAKDGALLHSDDDFFSLHLDFGVLVFLGFFQCLNYGFFQLAGHLSLEIFILHFHTSDKVDNFDNKKNELFIVFFGHDSIVNKNVRL